MSDPRDEVIEKLTSQLAGERAYAEIYEREIEARLEAVVADCMIQQNATIERLGGMIELLTERVDQLTGRASPSRSVEHDALREDYIKLLQQHPIPPMLIGDIE